MQHIKGFETGRCKILLGTTYFGDALSEAQAFAILDAYYEAGGRYLDTARSYAGGESEKVIARWLKERGYGDVFVSTKGGLQVETGKGRLSEKDIRLDLEQSLGALNKECVDFYWLHRDDKAVAVAEVITYMNALLKEEKIAAFGASNWTIERIEEANAYAKAHGLCGFSASQIRFSPAVPAPCGDMDKSLVDMDNSSLLYYGKKGMPVAAFASQAKGFFAKLDKAGEAGLSPKAKSRYYCEENLRRLKVLQTIAKDHATCVAAAVCAVMCAIRRPEIFPIIGGSSPLQIKESMKGKDIQITQNELNEIFGFM